MTQTTCDEVGPINTCDQVTITDNDIEKLLFEAEGRLQARDVIFTDTAEIGEVTRGQPQHTLLSIPKLSSGRSLQPYLVQTDILTTINTTRILTNVKDTSSCPRPKEPKGTKSSTTNKDKPTAGSDWFDLPKTELTLELKRDLQLLRMRSVLDSKRHYKKENVKAQPPKYSQVGTIVEGPIEFFSGRIHKKNRKKTFVEEVLAQKLQTRRFDSKYRDIQISKQSGKKSFYRNLHARRRTNGK
ncbi:Fcf2 pre-rRNA processing-domain-containing protein [Aspergillus coremiiformis]|uniref:Fcf2 pre-rRNA processing-domain-containing protein n=1 Tax=Aspergillus coremiiformis TaxID=138285 RepID=A0A5N6YRU1_9EURO|nr:Fcf2 pre-rRNA processing-domain-containing protein [Aspergillus coremiiformis]